MSLLMESKRAPRVRIPLPPPRSLDCREISQSLPEFPANSPPIPGFRRWNRTAEKATPKAKGHLCRNFLCRAMWQSGFFNRNRPMECDQKNGMYP